MGGEVKIDASARSLAASVDEVSSYTDAGGICQYESDLSPYAE
jgi:hypothetical protein